jgi:hypothetical protein
MNLASGLMRAVLFFAMVVAVCGLQGVQAAPAVDPSRVVVMISVDGLAAFYRDDPRA